MAAEQKQSLPSFSSTISVLSIVFYCVGFLRVELDMNEQKNRITALENVAEANQKSNDVDMKIKNAPGKLVFMKYKLGGTLIFMQPLLGPDGNLSATKYCSKKAVSPGRSGAEQVYPLAGVQSVGAQHEKRRAKMY